MNSSEKPSFNESKEKESLWDALVVLGTVMEWDEKKKE